MSMRITRNNLEALKSAMEDVVNNWDNISDAIDTWIEFQETPPTDEYGKDDRRSSREEIDSNIEDVERALNDAALLFAKSK